MGCAIYKARPAGLPTGATGAHSRAGPQTPGACTGLCMLWAICTGLAAVRGAQMRHPAQGQRY